MVGRGAMSARASASRSAARACGPGSAAAAHRGEPRRIGEQRPDEVREPRGRRLAVGKEQTPRPRRTRTRALWVWWSPGACGYGHEDGGHAGGGELGDGRRTGPADHEIGGGVREVHPVEVGHRAGDPLDPRRRSGSRRVSSSAAGPVLISSCTSPRCRQRAASPTAASVSRAAPRLPPLKSSSRAPSGTPYSRAGLGPQRRPVERGERRGDAASPWCTRAHRPADAPGCGRRRRRCSG